MNVHSTTLKLDYAEARQLVFDDWCNEFVSVTISQWPTNTSLSFSDSRNDQSGGVDSDDVWVSTEYIIAKAPHDKFRSAVETGGLTRLTDEKMDVTPDREYLVEATLIFLSWADGREYPDSEYVGQDEMNELHDAAYIHLQY